MLVDWICECSSHFRLALTTAHVAVGLMDKALPLIDVRKDRSQLVALACLIVAAKYEEREEDVPPLPKIVGYIENRQGGRVVAQYEAKRVYNMEVLVLTTLNFCCTVPTALHFVTLFERSVRGPRMRRARTPRHTPPPPSRLCSHRPPPYPPPTHNQHSQGVLCPTDTVMGKPLQGRTIKYLTRYTQFFADLCLQDYAFNAFKPSVVAGATIVCARRALNIHPPWVAGAFEEVLGYGPDAAEPVIKAMWRLYETTFPAEAAETRANEERSAAARAVADAARAAEQKRKRQERFAAGAPTPLTEEEAERKKARAERFGLPMKN